ncbi:MAG: ATP-binding protein [Verrucomicrobiota bacterium]|nr:ATP-binding protein [Limisphaera sp.]MDW8381543.1 ATP-binding protein [Verrucomicrobiota bacterium]
MGWLWVGLGLLLGAGAVHVIWWRRCAHLRREYATARARWEALHAQLAEEAQTRLTAMLHSLSEGILLLDPQQRVMLANPAFRLLFQPAVSPEGQSLLTVTRWHELGQMVTQLAPEEPALTRELLWAGPPERWLRVSAAALFHPDGRRLNTILVFHDVTRIKQLERIRQEFVANVSHELRTPLSHIKGYVETLLSGAATDPALQQRCLQTIARNANRLELLIEDLLTLAQLESGQVALQLQAVSLPEFVDKMIQEFRPRAAARAVTLEQTVPPLLVRADPLRLEQVLANLLDNAIKYGRQGGHVRVSARLRGADQVEVAVADDGPGLPPEACERVFERFYRVDKARSREQGGTGLGLAIVKHIVQRHGGKVWVESRLGQGATFYFTLAAMQETASADPGLSSSVASGVNAGQQD